MNTKDSTHIEWAMSVDAWARKVEGAPRRLRKGLEILM